mgnify:FL=1
MKTHIIVEFASSWNADPDLMKAMIKAAAENGADICKLQDYRAKHISDSDSDKKRYEKYQMPDELYPQFIKWCKEYGVEPLTTCFNADRCEFLAGLGLKKIKLASISLTNTELIMAAGLHFEEVIVSTAMSSREEIEEAVDLLASNAQKFTIMACTANYPTKSEDANLERINAFKGLLEGQEYGSVGFSSHALDLDVDKIALCMDIKYLEVHFSLARELPQVPHRMFKDGPLVTTHSVSLIPYELKELSSWRDKVEIIKGNGTFQINEIESKIKDRYLTRYGR